MGAKKLEGKFLIIPFSFLEALITFLPVHRHALPLALQRELHVMQWLTHNTRSTWIQIIAVQFMVNVYKPKEKETGYFLYLGDTRALIFQQKLGT